MKVYVCRFSGGYCGGLVVVAAEKARDATTYIGCQLSDSQQVRLAAAAIRKVFNELNYNENHDKGN